MATKLAVGGIQWEAVAGCMQMRNRLIRFVCSGGRFTISMPPLMDSFLSAELWSPTRPSRRPTTAPARSKQRPDDDVVALLSHRVEATRRLEAERRGYTLGPRGTLVLKPRPSTPPAAGEKIGRAHV